MVPASPVTVHLLEAVQMISALAVPTELLEDVQMISKLPVLADLVEAVQMVSASPLPTDLAEAVQRISASPLLLNVDYQLHYVLQIPLGQICGRRKGRINRDFVRTCGKLTKALLPRFVEVDRNDDHAKVAPTYYCRTWRSLSGQTPRNVIYLHVIGFSSTERF